MHVTSDAGTQLVVDARRRARRRRLGLHRQARDDRALAGRAVPVLSARALSVNGTLVLAPGDVNLTFKRYLESKVTLLVQNDYVTRHQRRRARRRA